MALPAIAVVRLPVDSRVAGGYAAVISLLVYWLYSHDQRQARVARLRVDLHLLELLGGWPGAFTAHHYQFDREQKKKRAPASPSSG